LNAQVDPETMAVDVIGAVGPGGHFLSQKHTRKHMRHSMKRSITQQLDHEGNYRPALEVAREKFAWIYENHHPDPLDETIQNEIDRIIDIAGRELE
jgi:trimethylamine--corrinoid protein Co-methyltransferase